VLKAINNSEINRKSLNTGIAHIAMVLLEKRNIEGAAEHLCRAFEILTNKRVPKIFISEYRLKLCVLYLKKIPKKLIPEGCRKKL
jgi:hypothetical protein